MARSTLVLTVLAALALALVPSAHAVQFGAEGFGLAGAPGPNLPSHANQFFRDGTPTFCGDPSGPSSPIVTPTRRAYKSRVFTSFVNESVCVTVSVSTACTGGNEIMSESYSPAFDPENITANWIGDLGNSPPNQTSYSFTLAAGARFETVVDEVLDTANCGGVDVTWSSDRPWAAGRPSISGLPAIGRTLTSAGNAWAGTPSVATQWQRCDAAGNGCTDIPGASGTSYTVGDADLGSTFRLRETATEGGLTSTLNGIATRIPAFIPVAAHENASLAAGDAATPGALTMSATPSRCEAPKQTPAASQGTSRFYDTYAITSLVNEPACVWVAQQSCFATMAVYSPQFAPADVRQNYVGDDSGSSALSFTLAPGTSATAAVFDTSVFGCSSYSLFVGSDGPFATARPELSGAPTAGSPVATTNGSWPGSPAFAHAWLRCDTGGAGCAQIGGANGPSYTPTADDVGSTLRSRVTATQGKSLSADSAASAVVAAAPAGDSTGPRAVLALRRTTLQKVVKRGHLPVSVTCDEDCAVTLRAHVARRLRRHLGGARIARGKGSGVAGRRFAVKVKLTRKARRGLRRRRSLAFTIEATAVDAAGNRRTASKRARVRRRR
jgi:hypothetical protein